MIQVGPEKAKNNRNSNNILPKKLGLQKQLTFKQLKSFLESLNKKEA